MDAATIECLGCGATRTVESRSHVRGECPRCGYLGWAESASLTETLRRRLRDRPLELRKPPRVAT